MSQMDPLSLSGRQSHRASLLLPSKPAQGAPMLPRVKSQRCVKFDPIVGDGATGSVQSGGPSLDSSLVHNTGTDGDAGDPRRKQSTSDASISALPLYPSDMHDLEDLEPFELTRDDVVAAFEFLDINRSGLLTIGNLKHRLSAFFPAMTTKEYKFLVEDPNSTTHTNGTTSSGARAVQGTQSGGAAEGGSGSAEGFSPSPPTVSVSPTRPANTSSGVVETNPSKDALPAEGGSGSAGGFFPPGGRSGLDVDQLWGLINSFQQLQRSFGSGAVGTFDGHDHNGSRSAFDASIDAYLVGSQASDSGPSGRGRFDAVGEAFRVYDPRNTHYVEESILSCIMARVGFGDLSSEELAVLVSTADFDGDGRISLEDFRRLVNMKGRFKK